MALNGIYRCSVVGGKKAVRTVQRIKESKRIGTIHKTYSLLYLITKWPCHGPQASFSQSLMCSRRLDEPRTVGRYRPPKKIPIELRPDGTLLSAWPSSGHEYGIFGVMAPSTLGLFVTQMCKPLTGSCVSRASPNGGHLRLLH